VTMLLYRGLGAIIMLETEMEPTLNTYRIIVNMFLACICLDFVDMVVSSIRKNGQYVNCKHLYYLFRYFCKLNLEEDKFVHAPSFSFNKVKRLLATTGIIDTSTASDNMSK
jgi:hypothetical protein